MMPSLLIASEASFRVNLQCKASFTSLSLAYVYFPSHGDML